MSYRRFLKGGILLALAFATLALSLDSAPAAASFLATQLVVSGLDVPSFVTSPPGDSSRLFIAELNTGKIHIVKDGVLLPQPFLQIPFVSTGNERGFLAIAFHPDYASNGYFYVSHTSSVSGGHHIRRFTVSADPDIADSNSMLSIMQFPPPQSNHVGGWIGFGPDGYLYISKGDGFISSNGQSQATLLGKILRIDVDAGTPYGIPPSNPYAGEPAPRNHHWAAGLRNPWRCAFDRANGDFYITDVGDADWEELNYQPAASAGGENYGWDLFEGNEIQNCPMPCDSSGLTWPILAVPHLPDPPPTFCAITGGYVYRGAAIPSFQGTYFYGDFCSGQLWTLRVVGGQAVDVTNRTAQLAPLGGESIDLVVSFGEDASGELYICDYTGGEVFKIVNNPTNVGASPETPAARVTLGPAFPNPSAAGFQFRVGLASAQDARVAVYDPAGRRVRQVLDRGLATGTTTLGWNGRDDRGSRVAPGVYVLRLDAGSETRSQKLTVTR